MNLEKTDIKGCFAVAMSGNCGPDCYVYLNCECEEPQEMIQFLDEEGLILHRELYGD